MMRALAIYSIVIVLMVIVNFSVIGSHLNDPRPASTYEDYVFTIVLTIICVIPILIFSVIYLIRDRNN